jgi:hypothetical protein
MTIRTAIITLAIALSVSSALQAEEKLPFQAVQVYWHVYEGDPAGSEKEGTKKSISQGWFYPGAGFDSPVQDGGKSQGMIPGMNRSFEDGIVVQANIRSATATQVVADLRVDESLLSETESSDVMASQGDTYRLAGKFAVDTPYRIWLKRKSEDTPRWAEVHFSALTPVNGPLTPEEKPESTTRVWLPNWRWSSPILPVKLRK